MKYYRLGLESKRAVEVTAIKPGARIKINLGVSFDSGEDLWRWTNDDAAFESRVVNSFEDVITKGRIVAVDGGKGRPFAFLANGEIAEIRPFKGSSRIFWIVEMGDHERLSPRNILVGVVVRAESEDDVLSTWEAEYAAYHERNKIALKALQETFEAQGVRDISWHWPLVHNTPGQNPVPYWETPEFAALTEAQWAKAEKEFRYWAEMERRMEAAEAARK